MGRLEQSKADGSAGFKFYVEGGKGLTEKINFEQTWRGKGVDNGASNLTGEGEGSENWTKKLQTGI